MIVLKPVPITDAMLLSSSVPETDHPVWAAGTSYAAGQRVIKGHRIWEGLQASTGKDPEAGLVDAQKLPYWLEVSSTNRWRMFDATVNSLTVATNSLVVDVQPGAIDSVGLIELVGTTAKVELFDGAALIYTRTAQIDNTIILSWLDYFFEEYESASVLVFDGLPKYRTGKVRITITGPGEVACGSAVLGTTYELGEAQLGVGVGINDYSKKETNIFGVTKIVQRAFSKRNSVAMRFDTPRLRRVYALLAELRATPCLWIAAPHDVQTYAPLVVFGFWRDFNIEIAYPQVSLCSLELEGMI